MAKRGRPKKSNLTAEQLAILSAGTDEVSPLVADSAIHETVDPTKPERPRNSFRDASVRNEFVMGLATALVIEMCKTKGLSLDDHADYAYKSANKLADLLEL